MLNGKSIINITNLTGKSQYENSNKISYKIKILLDRIVKDYIIPLFSEQWEVLNENVFFISDIQNKLKVYYDIYKTDTLLVYYELLKVIDILIKEHNLLIDSESKYTVKKDPNNVVNMVYKTTMIKLLPEYEIYDSILGKPNRSKKETYDETIIDKIKYLMSLNNINYQRIKEHIMQLRS